MRTQARVRAQAYSARKIFTHKNADWSNVHLMDALTNLYSFGTRSLWLYRQLLFMTAQVVESDVASQVDTLHSNSDANDVGANASWNFMTGMEGGQDGSKFGW